MAAKAPLYFKLIGTFYTLFEEGFVHLLAEISRLPLYSDKYDEHLKEIEE